MAWKGKHGDDGEGSWEPQAHLVSARDRRDARAAHKADRARGTGRRRHDEWRCHKDGKRNFLSRDSCRECGGSYNAGVDSIFRGNGTVVEPTGFEPAARAGSSKRSLSQSPGSSSVPDEGDAIARLSKALAVAKEAHLPEHILEEISSSLDEARKQKKASRPIGAQIDSARAAHARAAKAVEAAEAAVEQAVAKVTEAGDRADEAKAAEKATKEELDALLSSSKELHPDEAAISAPAQALAQMLSALEASDLGPRLAEGSELQVAIKVARDSLSRSPKRGKTHASPKPKARPKDTRFVTLADSSDDDADDEVDMLEDNIPVKRETADTPDLVDHLNELLRGELDVEVRSTLADALAAARGAAKRRRMAQPVV